VNTLKDSHITELNIKLVEDDSGQHKKLVHFDVIDTGPGVPRDMEERLFDRFAQDLMGNVLKDSGSRKRKLCWWKIMN
jgi:K+-sensing histidine kinase KdpD